MTRYVTISDQRRDCRSRGIALLEVMISLMLLSFGTVGLMTFEKVVDDTLNNAHHKLQAADYIDNYLESLRTRGADSSLSEASVVDFVGITNQTITLDHGLTLHSEVLERMIGGTVKKIRVTVSWKKSDGNQNSVSVTTMISQYSEFDSR
jgi:type IV pilus assembly protein PilV